MQPEQTTTPLRQLYFIIQTVVIDPANAATAKRLFDDLCRRLYDTIDRDDLHAALREIRQLVEGKRYYEALKMLRSCFKIDDDILEKPNLCGAQQ